jgi:hypothetical protein
MLLSSGPGSPRKICRPLELSKTFGGAVFNGENGA